MRTDLNLDYSLLLPELVLCGLAIFILFMGLWPDAFVDRISPTVTNFLLGYQ